MTPQAWLAVPIAAALLAAAVLALLRPWRIAVWVHRSATVVTLAATAHLIWLTGAAGPWLWADRLTVHMAVLAGVMALAAAIHAPVWLEAEINAWRLPAAAAHRQLALCQVLHAAVLLALLANDLVLCWVALVAAILSLRFAATLPGTPAARIASRTSLGFGVIGLLLVLFGVMLFQLSALPRFPAGDMLGWNQIRAAATHADTPGADGALLSLGFVLFLVGAVVIAGIALWPVTAAPAPLTGLLGLALAGAILAALLRVSGIVTSHVEALPPGALLLGLGGTAVLFGVRGCLRHRELWRVIDHATITHLGLAIIGFGIGSHFAALLHLSLLALTRAALLPIAGLATFATPHRAGALTIGAGLLALAALPPFGLFASLFLLFVALLRDAPWMAVLVGAALLVLMGRLLAELPALIRPGVAPATPPPMPLWTLVPGWVLLVLTANLGFAMPNALVAWLTAIERSFPGAFQ